MRAIVCILVSLLGVACDEERTTPPGPVAPLPAAAPLPALAPMQSNAPGSPVVEGRSIPLEMEVGDSVANSVGGSIAAVDVQTTPGRYVFTVTSKGTSCSSPDGQKHAVLMLTIDGVQKQQWTLDSDKFTDRSSVPLPLAEGKHHVSVDFINDHYTGPGCDRNAWVSVLRIVREQ